MYIYTFSASALQVKPTNANPFDLYEGDILSAMTQEKPESYMWHFQWKARSEITGEFSRTLSKGLFH